MQKISAEREAFRYFLRTGRRLPPPDGTVELKFNPYHDPRGGRFTFAPGGAQSLSRVIISNRRSSTKTGQADRSVEVPISSRSAEPSVALSEAAYLNEGGTPALEPAQYRPRGRGSNQAPFEDPMTLEQVFPGLGNSPGGAIISGVANMLDLTGPGEAAYATTTLMKADILLRQIKAIDPGYQFQSLGFPQTREGQVRQIDGLRLDRAEAFYRVRGELRPLQVETIRFLQRSVDEAYHEGILRLEGGNLKMRLSEEEALGNFVDRAVRRRLQEVYNGLRISTAQGKVRIIGREYITNGSDRTYRVPDARVSDVAFDWTLTRKTGATPQVRGFFNSDSSHRA